MPWSNQGGGGPWGSGSRKGPWGSGPQPSGGGSPPPDLEELLRRSQDRLRNVLPGGNLGGRGIALIVLVAVALWGLSGFFRVEPDELGVVLRFGKFIARGAAGPELSPALSDRDRADAAGAARQQASTSACASSTTCPPRRHATARRAGRKPDADRRREHRRRRFLGAVADQAERRRRLSVQYPEPGRHREGGGRKRHARGHRPLEHPADPDRQSQLSGPQKNIESGRPVQNLMQKTLDEYQRRHPDHAGPVQKVDPPAQVIDSFRDVQAARIGSRARAERGADLRQPRRAGSARPRRQDHPGRRSLSRADRRRGQGRDLALPADLRAIQKGAGCHPRAHVSGNHGTHPRRHRQDDHRYRPRRPGVVPYLPLTELPTPPSRSSTPRTGTSSTGGAQ